MQLEITFVAAMKTTAVAPEFSINARTPPVVSEILRGNGTLMIQQLLIMNLKYCPLRSDEECLYVSFLMKQLQLLNAFSLTYAKLVRCCFFSVGGHGMHGNVF